MKVFRMFDELCALLRYILAILFPAWPAFKYFIDSRLYLRIGKRHLFQLKKRDEDVCLRI